jgi:hypothetical protein
MNDEHQTPENEVEPEEDIVEDTPAPTELDLLKGRAKAMGIKFSGNISVTKLKARMDDKINGVVPEKEEAKDEKVVVKMSPRQTKIEQEQELRDRLQKEKMRLRRVQIYNLNPAKNDLQGELISVGNKYIGTVNRFIPFGEATEAGTHIEQVLYDDLKSRRFQQLRFKRSKDGDNVPESKWVPEYNLVDLAPLSGEELSELALNQEAANRINKD